MSFESKEFERRFDRAQELIAESNFDVLLVSAIENTEYFGAGAGLDDAWHTQFANSISFPTIVLVPAAGELTIIAHNTFSRVIRQTIGDLYDIRTYYETGREEQQPYVDMTIERLCEGGADNGTIGVELGTGYTTDPKIGMPMGDFLAIQKGVPNAEFIDGSEVLRRLRMIKSDAEIEAIRQATKAIDRTFDACFDELGPGMTEPEIVDVCNRLVSKHGARPVWTLVSSTPGAILPQPGERLERGDTVFLDIGATVGGYHADYNRMATVGEPSAIQRDRCRTIAEITDTLVQTVKPGITAANVVETCLKEFDRRDLDGPPGTASPTKIGHSIGLTLSEAPQVAGYETTTLEPGMVLCLEPGIMADDGVYMTEEIVLVTDDGSERISGMDTDLYRI